MKQNIVKFYNDKLGKFTIGIGLVLYVHFFPKKVDFLKYWGYQKNEEIYDCIVVYSLGFGPLLTIVYSP